jgi:hypothetical protein
MDDTIIIISFVLVIACGIFFFTEDKIYESHLISPVSGGVSKFTVCIQDPKLNRGFVISLKNLNELKEIQGSLNNSDQKYIIDYQNGNYVLINRSHKREQITKICDYTNIEKIIKKNKTKHIDYSV